MTQSNAIDPHHNATDLNRAAYAKPRILGVYERETGLTHAEAAVFARNVDLSQLPFGSVLDMGIGAGRTSAALSALGRPYLGFDFVPEMVQAARRLHPTLDLRVMDARDLSAIAPASVALAVFSFNGIDSTGAEFRSRVLEEVARVVVPGGVFVFSSHNLAFKDLESRVRPVRPHMSLADPLGSARRLLGFARASRAAGRLAPFQSQSSGIAVFNDDAHGHALLQCYIQSAYQRQLLEAAGFELVELANSEGQPALFDSAVPDSDALHYVARRS
jgi:SAM-dependent methyltransferase